MAEISESPPNLDEAPSQPHEAAPEFDPKTMRTTEPGLKRLLLTCTVLLSFILGFPLLWKSVEIYRSPLPFEDIDSVANDVESIPLMFPCHFQVIFINYSPKVSGALNPEHLKQSISAQITKLTSQTPQCGSCSHKFTLSVTVDSDGSGCSQSDANATPHLYNCGGIHVGDLNFGDDEGVDEALELVLGNRAGVDGERAVVGKYRHAWIQGKDLEVDSEVERVAELLVKVFANGGREEGVIHGEFMPVGADGRIVLSFNLLNADPGDWVFDWDFETIDQTFLVPMIEALAPIANISVESQVLYHTPKSSFSTWDERLGSFIFSTKDLPFFVRFLHFLNCMNYVFNSLNVLKCHEQVNSNEWHLDTSLAAGGRSKILQFVVYILLLILVLLYLSIIFNLSTKFIFNCQTSFLLLVNKNCVKRSMFQFSLLRYVPSANECPLLLQLPNGKISATNGFISPMWGGVVVWNPQSCLKNSESKLPDRHLISAQDLQNIFQVFMGQFRQLFGLNSESLYAGSSGSCKLLASERGFTEWELDVLSRQHTCFNLHSSATTLGSLSRLVQSLPRMIIMDEIRKQVKFSLEAAKLAQSNASLGIYDISAVSSRHARSLAEDAFFHPSIMSVSYYSFEHCFAVYSQSVMIQLHRLFSHHFCFLFSQPFFLPVSMHVLLAALREWKRYKQEKAKYLLWKAKVKSVP
ncbi:hypothetical protein Tsubulata_010490 [Turnera subulata]|uniref:GPI transamidase component PIG-S n=1 Tax=Turnera subulata TaxID=218843 RepID=A0A9Q0FCK0_9ROSI|nr:hypothetical protein Tsubulata_010490 [Turnera subulata]